MGGGVVSAGARLKKNGRAIQGLEDVSQGILASHIYLGILESAPVNIMWCDRDLIVRYVNPKSLETLKVLEKHIPISAEEILGTNIDDFHKNPEMQRKILANPKNLPHKAIIELGPEKLELNVNAVFDGDGQYTGAMVVWDIVTQKLEVEKNLGRVQSMMENMPINVILADRNLNIVYLNPKSIQTLRSIDKLLPIPVDKIVGSSIDVFHKNPQHQRKMLADERNLPHQANIKLGPETLSLLISPIYDNNKNYLGPMVTWDIISEKVTLVETLEETSNQLAAASEELSATAHQLSANSEKTTEESNSAASATEEVSRGVQVVATNTEEMVASIKEISESSAKAAEMAKDALSQAQTTNNTMQKLGMSSKEIGNVIKVISSIAQQTNLLALNATIEAARAGDAGKGFAVVANEVKELAKQTATATEEITNKIEAIQKDSDGAVHAIGGIAEAIEKLNGIALTTAAAVEEQTATTNDVARVVQEAKEGVDGIAGTVRAVSKASEENSAGARQTLDASQGLNQLATRLKDLVKEIKV